MKDRPREDLVPTDFKVRVRAHIIRDLEQMAKHTKQPVDELVTKALLMFIATHGDYLGKK